MIEWLLVMYLYYPNLPGYEHQQQVLGIYTNHEECLSAKQQVKAVLDQQFPGNTTVYECQKADRKL